MRARLPLSPSREPKNTRDRFPAPRGTQGSRHEWVKTRFYVQRPVMCRGVITKHVPAAQREIAPVGALHNRPVREGLPRPRIPRFPRVRAAPPRCVRSRDANENPAA